MKVSVDLLLTPSSVSFPDLPVSISDLPASFPDLPVLISYLPVSFLISFPEILVSSPLSHTKRIFLKTAFYPE